MSLSRALSTNNYGPAKFIVAASAANGTHTTIAAAITAASSGDTIAIRPGTYTENLTLKAGVNLVAYGPSTPLFNSSTTIPNVIINGTCSFSAAGTVGLDGICLQTNSAVALSVTGSAASIVILNNCFLNCLNNTGITFSSSSSGSLIDMGYCAGTIATTGISLFNHSGAGNISIDYCTFVNPGATTTSSTLSSTGNFSSSYSFIDNSFNLSSTGSMFGRHCNFSMGANQTIITASGASASSFFYCFMATNGAASAISIGASASVAIHNGMINSGNASPITGAGSLIYTDVSFNSVFGINNTGSLSPFPSTSAWKFIATQTASSSASIVFSRGITAQHNNYVLDIAGAVPDTNAVSFNLQFSTDGGATWLSTGFNTKVTLVTAGANGETNSTALVPLVQAGNTMQNTANEGWNGQILIQNATSGSTPRIMGQGSYFTSNQPYPCLLSGRGPAATTVNAMRLIMSSGNISTGSFTLYALL